MFAALLRELLDIVGAVIGIGPAVVNPLAVDVC